MPDTDLAHLKGLSPLLRSLHPVPTVALSPTEEPLRFVEAPALGTPARLLRPLYKPVAPPIGRASIAIPLKSHEPEADV